MLSSYLIEKHRETSSKKFTLIVGISLLSLISFFAIVSSPSPKFLSAVKAEESEFHEFMVAFDKSYEGEEYYSRFQKFRNNLAYIRQFNSLENSMVLGVNEFADMDFVEFKNTYYPNTLKIKYTEDKVDFEGFTAPSKVDWQSEGAVTPVKNQGPCGGCWSFAATGSIEAAWFLAGNELVSLSEQQLIDCSKEYGNDGCDNGLEDYAFQYVIDNKGITTESNYAFTGQNDICNNTKASQVVATISSYKLVVENDPIALQAAVAQQPISARVQKSQAVWQLYRSGIITDSCGTDIDHSVLIVGYDTTATTPYWIVKNSWGISWGTAGYVQIAISSGEGVCGINMHPTYPIV